MKESNRVELLAPAGNYESFLGAVHAGADAVYLGGDKFGARAYADNFTTEQLCSAIQYAHLYGRKVYLTLNTLVKEKEMPQLYDYLLPFYEAGLDGVIIQDMGVFFYVKEHFPDLPLHASTQMTITGVEGARMLKEIGAQRIVPARELSLEEISLIKKEAKIEIETFIHGAMCYCYSGQCLFSSILGGRSGNRGKCAQPCRLPYGIKESKEKALYYLSLKDMCTIEMLPALIEAGITSFKIEGRMKKPEYAAGVTAIYRKYIDLYYERERKKALGDKPFSEKFSVDKEDKEKLNSLYIRSEVQNGYYHRHNGASMVTKEKPGYNESNAELLKRIRDRYIENKPHISITGRVFLSEGRQAELCVEGSGASVTVKGAVVQKAIKQPMTIGGIKKQLEKCGGTPFEIEKLVVEAGENVFMPLKELNELRRQALEQLEKEIKEKNGFLKRTALRKEKAEKENEDKISQDKEKLREENAEEGISVLIRTRKQLYAVETLLKDRNQKKDGSSNTGSIQAVFVSTDILEFEFDKMKENEEKKNLEKIKQYLNGNVFAACPYIMRAKDAWLLACLLREKLFAGILVRNMEELAFLKREGYDGKIITDAGLYVWNKKAADFFCGKADFYTLPFELNSGEQSNVRSRKSFQIVYGRIPMMITANCIRKTRGECFRGKEFLLKKEETLILTDRYGKGFPVVTDCRHCYNTIYNSVPLSLHKEVIKQAGRYRLDFTTEDEKETRQIIEYFCRIYVQAGEEPPYKDYTNGHNRRGVD